METKSSPETEKCLKGDVPIPPPSGESATEVAASVFDLTFDPNCKTNKNAHKSLWPQILACIAAASFHLPVGIVVGFSAILIPQLEDPDSEIKVTKEETSWIASLAVLVVPVGALISGYLVDALGRLNTIRIACIPYTIGWILIASANNLTMILVGRFLTGFTLAMGPSPAIVYITEVARPDLRGSLICLGPSLTSFGMLLIFIKGAALHWRTVAWMGICYSVLPLLFMWLWAPESPVWLLSKGKSAQALESLKFLARGEPSGGLAERQFAVLQKEADAKATESQAPVFRRFFRGFAQPTGYKPAMILFMLFFFQQFSGIYITIFYAVTFFEEVKSGFNVYMSTILIGLIRMLVGLLTSFLLKRFGRRTLCIVSGLGMTVTLFISGYYTRLIFIGEITKSLVPVVCILLYMSLSVTGLMSIPWTMTAELFPLEIRGLAQGLIISLAHVVMFIALQIYRSLPDLLGGAYAVQWLFAGVSFVSVIFVFIFVPETHKKKLSEIQDYFLNNSVYILSLKKKKKTPTIVRSSTTGSQQVPSNNNQNV